MRLNLKHFILWLLPAALFVQSYAIRDVNQDGSDHGYYEVALDVKSLTITP